MIKTRFVRSALVLFAVGAATCLLADDAQAQCYRGARGGGGLRISVGYGGYGGYGAAFGYSSRYRRPVWHDTSHYDFYPGRFVRHGRHFDYIPSHYHYHRTGHYHR